MGLVHDELSLGFRPSFVPKTITDFLKEISLIFNVTDRCSKLNDLINRLEDETRKIDASKLDLPLCMVLLNDAIQALKEEAMQCAKPKTVPVLEEFIPLKKECDTNTREPNLDNREKHSSKDKKNWMSSVQLWNTDHHPHPASACDGNQGSEIESKRNGASNGIANEVSLQNYIDQNGGRAFVPFKAYPAFPVTAVKEDKEDLALPVKSLLPPGFKVLKDELVSSASRSAVGRVVSFSAANVQSNIRMSQQQLTSRKQRRCWSEELHRRFVSALQQLGGSKVATPKQIRELMQVDGLTNDEVKSHLQKYRLHTRRVPAAKSAPANHSLDALGDMWMPQVQYNSKANSSGSGSPQGPLQLGESGGDDEADSGSDDAKTERYGWKGHIPKPGNDDI